MNIPPTRRATLWLLPALMAATVLCAAETPIDFPNGGFERGAEEWKIPAGSRFATIAIDRASEGKRSLKIVDVDAKSGSNVVGPRLRLPSPGMYQLRGKVYPVSGNGLGIYLRLYDARGRVFPGESHVIGLGGSQQKWRKFTADVEAPPGAVSAEVWIHSYNAAKVEAYLDDFQLVRTVPRQEGANMSRDLKVIKQRLYEMALGGGGRFEDIHRHLQTQRPDGSWPDIDYADQNRTRWLPAGHVSRLHRMAQAFAHPKSPHHGNAKLRVSILRAFDYWTRHRPKCSNWWYNVIGVPRILYRAMLLIEDELSAEQMAQGLKVLEDAKLGMTGQNLVWVAEVNIARGCLADDPWPVQAAVHEMTKEIRFTAREGIQPDCSFYQHGTQLYSGGYGRGFSHDCAYFARLLRGTSFALPPAKIEVLTAYLLDGQQWMVRGSTFDPSACGRELSRRGACSAGSLIEACRNLLAADPPRSDELRAFLARLEKPSPQNALSGNRHFWRADYMAHHRPQFMFSVRMTSPRTLQTETCNEENLLGRHLSDGVTYIFRRGDEYRDIFPVWDWKRPPGITVELDGQPPVTRNGQRGRRDFVGGVSDNTYGLAAMDFARGALVARKAWVCLDRFVVCLGAGIECPTENSVITSVNQCLQRGPVRVSDRGGQRELQSGERRIEGPAWALHDGIGYIFPAKSDVVVANQPQSGDWHRINHVYPSVPLSKAVFSLWLEHGRRAHGAEYEYLVAPAASIEQIEKWLHTSPVRVLANRVDLQAVYSPEEKLLAAAFYEPGEIEPSDGTAVSVDRPCLLLWRETNSGTVLAVSNPKNKSLELTVTASARVTGEGTSWDDAAGLSRIRIRLPDGELAGSSVIRQFHRDGSSQP